METIYFIELFTKTGGTTDWTRTESDYWHLNGTQVCTYQSNISLLDQVCKPRTASRMCRIAWRRKEQLLWTEKWQFFSPIFKKEDWREVLQLQNHYSVRPPSKSLWKTFSREMILNVAFGPTTTDQPVHTSTRQWYTSSTITSTSFLKDYRITGSHSLFLQWF